MFHSVLYPPPMLINDNNNHTKNKIYRDDLLRKKIKKIKKQ